MDIYKRERRGGRVTIMKLLNQFEQVERATPLARREEGKISINFSLVFSRSISILDVTRLWDNVWYDIDMI
jgi:hypothetical protein